MKWELIETAPKDGTDILLWDGSHREIGYWYTNAINGVGFWANAEITLYPTHWMPLPPPPDKEGTD